MAEERERTFLTAAFIETSMFGLWMAWSLSWRQRETFFYLSETKPTVAFFVAFTATCAPAPALHLHLLCPACAKLSRSRVVWPDLAKFCHFGIALKTWPFWKCSFSIWKHFVLTLANFKCSWAIFQCFKWPNIKQIIQQSGHTDPESRWFSSTTKDKLKIRWKFSTFGFQRSFI